MNNYDRRLFDGKCPYTDEPCVNDIDCYECETDREERHLFEAEQGDEKMLKFQECTRINFCSECDDEKCLNYGSIEADCPKYHCDLPEPMTNDCEHCSWIKAYKKDKSQY